jgi:hypothetical protein
MRDVPLDAGPVMYDTRTLSTGKPYSLQKGRFGMVREINRNQYPLKTIFIHHLFSLGELQHKRLD